MDVEGWSQIQSGGGAIWLSQRLNISSIVTILIKSLARAHQQETAGGEGSLSPSGLLLMPGMPGSYFTH
ncbi:MAG: hypothetical protein ACOY90_21365 [Candidatus Zhuqueibacterota bacterium]